MTEILGYRGDSNRTNESILQSDNSAYDSFSFQMGLAYYYYYEDVGNKPMSRTWFQTAADSATLDTSQVERAKRLGRIAGYYTSLNSSDRAGDSTVTYQDYWNDLTSLSEGNLVKMDNVKTALVVYKELVYQIGQNALNFKSAGVTESELTERLEYTRARLETDIESAGGNREETEELRESILQNIQWAQNEVEVVFSARSYEEAEEAEQGE